VSDREAEARLVEIGKEIEALEHERQRLVSSDPSRAVRSASGPALCIVGGRGGMGCLFDRVLCSRGYRVSVLEEGDDIATDARIDEADVVMLAVPMAIAEETARVVANRMQPGTLLCDINSLKRDVCDAMSEARGEVLGLHPMFGPSVRSFNGQKVVACDVVPGPLGQALVQDLEALGATIVHASPEEHDRMMAVVQVLLHFSTIVMGEALRRTGMGIQDSLRFTSPIYRLELAVVGRIFTQNADLYGEILMSNPYGTEVRAAFVDAARDIAELVDSGDRSAFVDEFGFIAEWFRDFGPEAMALSDHIIEALVARG
jgi:chorismate mutase/prephenate dehydrogenase